MFAINSIKMNRMKLIVLFSFSLLFLMPGCMTFYEVDLKSAAIKNLPSSKTFMIKSINGRSLDGTLRQKQKVELIKKAFNDRGFQEVSKNAQYNIKVSYAISEPKTKKGSVPIIGQTGVSSSTTYGNYNSYTGSYNTTTYNNPSYGVVGTSNFSYEEYTRILSVKAYDNKGSEIFDTSAFSAGSSGDMDDVFPIMLYQMVPYLGSSLSRKVKKSVSGDSKKFREWLKAD